MYKYKKTIIINNRRRRIFSKEKSNAEYILYKNEYITLNAYNKKTGGGLLSNFVPKIFNKKTEFEILKNHVMLTKLNYELYIYNHDSILLSKYLNSNNGVLYKYYKNNSTIISKYLKENSKIDRNTDKKYWIIIKETYSTIIVHGYTMDEWIILYSKYIHNYYFTRYCNITKITLDSSNIAGIYRNFIQIYQNYPGIYSKPEHINLYFLDDIDSIPNETKEVYKKLQNKLSEKSEKSETFYIKTDLDKSEIDSFEIDKYYKLFENKSYYFKCISKPKLSDGIYDISFTFEPDYVQT